MLSITVHLNNYTSRVAVGGAVATVSMEHSQGRRVSRSHSLSTQRAADPGLGSNHTVSIVLCLGYALSPMGGTILKRVAPSAEIMMRPRTELRHQRNLTDGMTGTLAGTLSRHTHCTGTNMPSKGGHIGLNAQC